MPTAQPELHTEADPTRPPTAPPIWESWPKPAMHFSSQVEAPEVGTDDRTFWDLCRKHDRHRRAARMQFHSTEELITVRWGGSAVVEGLIAARERHPGVPIFVIGDLPCPDLPPELADVHLPNSLEEALEGEQPRVYMCVFQSDEDLLTALRQIVARPNAWYETPNAQAPVARYFHRNNTAHRVLLEQAAIDALKFELADHETLIQMLEETRDVPGCYCEVGVYKGRSARTALEYMSAAGIDREAYLLDVYDGFQYEHAAKSHDASWNGTHTDTSIDRVRAFVGDHAHVHVLRNNIITDGLPDQIDRIAVANIDVDMQEAVSASLERLAPRISLGGVMIVEDAGHTPRLAGAWLALDSFARSDAGRAFRSVYMASGQTLLIRIREEER